ncbi:MAG: hypothetical protein J7M19_00290 [Planctomycetes bacterium]|nr:hypothetical protein [Planctomycetota bacterium]
MKKLVVAAAVIVLLAPVVLAGPTTVTVTQIRASGSGGEVSIDAGIKDLKESLAKRFRFAKYAFLSRKSSTLSKGGTKTWKLADGNYLDIKFSGAEGNGNKVVYTLSLEVYSRTPKGRETIAKTTVKRSKGKAFLYGLGHSRTVGGTLILVIKAE